MTAATSTIRSERVLVRAVVFFRLGGLAQIGCALVTAHDRYPSLSPVVLLAALVWAESLAFIVGCLRRQHVPEGWLLADTVFCAFFLVAGAHVVSAQDGHSWAYFAYPFTIVTSVGIGVGLRKLTHVLVMTVVLSLSYAFSAVLLHHDPIWNVVPNSMSYYANTVVAWAVARNLRGTAQQLSVTHTAELEQARKLAEAQQRARYSRLLHDRVLQTLEALGNGTLVPDVEVRRYIAAEAAWLRAFVETGEPLRAGDLYADLQSVVRHKALAGLRVEFNATALLHDHVLRTSVPDRVREALLGAVDEALTNVLKHAAVRDAVLQVGYSQECLRVTVVDHGRAFDPHHVREGVGLRESIRGRMADVGGAARIESTPGSGTCVELSVPYQRARRAGSTASRRLSSAATLS